MNEDNIYIVKSGDNFWTLENEWNIPHGILQKLNPNIDPYRLKIGEKIVMPNLIYLCFVKKENLGNNKLGKNGLFTNGVHSQKKRNNIHDTKNSDKDSWRSFLDIGNNGIGGMGLFNTYRQKAYRSNELWHMQKNGIFVHRWKEMSNGASYWKNNIVSKNRNAFQRLANSRQITPRLLKGLGYGAILADVALEQKLKPSQAIAAAFLLGSSSGVVAIIAGAYFVVDLGFGIFTEHSLNERIDNSIGTVDISEFLNELR